MTSQAEVVLRNGVPDFEASQSNIRERVQTRCGLTERRVSFKTHGKLGVWVPPNAGDERLVELDDPNIPDPFAINANPLQRTPRFDSATEAVSLFKDIPRGPQTNAATTRSVTRYTSSNSEV